MSIAAAIQAIRDAGFQIEAEGDSIAIEPFDELSEKQVGWLKANKPAILAALRNPGSVLRADRGHDLAPANCPLPARLAIAAERVCREIHGDNDDQVAQMLADLAECPESDWDSLADHFESQPPPPESDDDRVLIHVPELTLSTGQKISCDMTVPKANLEKLRAVVKFRLKDGGGGGSVLGSPGTPREELVADLQTRYGSRLETIDGLAP